MFFVSGGKYSDRTSPQMILNMSRGSRQGTSRTLSVAKPDAVWDEESIRRAPAGIQSTRVTK